ncbi:MAG TPA: response regulator, partial [Nitrospirae bacterium]|nr:response regulator [Nitrospirota bacterium]
MNRTRILVADDSATIQKVFELAFENEDIEVILTSDGNEALETIRRESPSMVIADVNMPGLDGFELCRMLKNDEKSASIPVYLISSALDDFDELRSEEVGAAGRFEKPFRSEDMVTRVKAVISEIQSGGAIAPDDEIGGDMMEAIEDISVEGGGEPETEKAQEDTFDDIDISLDSLLDSVEHRVDSPVDEDSVIVVEGGAPNIDEEPQPDVDEDSVIVVE